MMRGIGFLMPAAAPVGGTTWDPGAKDSSVTLSGGNLTATKAAGAAWGIARGTTSKSSGKWYFEGTGSAGTSRGIGLVTSSEALNDAIGIDSDGIGGYQAGDIFNSGVTVATFGGWGSAGNVCGVAVDITAGTIWFRGPSGIWNGSGANNPATGVGGVSMGLSGALYPACCVFSSPDAIVGNFGGSAFSGAVPAGFTAWG